jgi:hypothetical protein
MNRQDIDGSPDVSQYTKDGIGPTHPSSRVKGIESPRSTAKKPPDGRGEDH